MSLSKNKELRMFEALENLTKHESFDSSASFVRHFVSSDLDLNNTHQSIPEGDEAILSPLPSEKCNSGDGGEEDDEEDDDSIIVFEEDGVEDVSHSERSVDEDGTDSRSVHSLSDEDDYDQRKYGESFRTLTYGEGFKNYDVYRFDNKKYEDEKGCRVLTYGKGFKNFDVYRFNNKKYEEEEGCRVLTYGKGFTNFDVFRYNREKHEEYLRNLEQEEKKEEKSVVSVDDEKDKRTLPPQSASRGADDEMEELLQVLKDKHGTEYLLLSEMKRTVELQESQLKREQEAFAKVRSAEQAKMQVEKKRVENQRKNLQSLITDYHKMKSSKDESQDKIKELTEQLRNTKLEMSKRISRWGDQQKRLEERVKTLEKENEELKKQKPTIPAKRAALKRPPMLPKPPSKNLKRIQFADDVAGSENRPGTSKTSAGASKPSASISNVTKACESAIKIGPENGNCDPDDSELSKNSSFENSNGVLKGANTNSSPKESTDSSVREVSLNDDDADKTMPSDYIEVTRPCGTITRVTKDNKFTRHIMINKDIMDELEDCSVRYYYRELGFSQTSYPNGDEVIEHDSGVLETSRSDGSKIYTYSDGIVKLVDPSGGEEIYFVDGSVMRIEPTGEKIITWPSGQKEVRTEMYVKRVYTNGTVKTMYADGSEETRYWNGRVRRKNKEGVLVDDTKKKMKPKKNDTPA